MADEKPTEKTPKGLDVPIPKRGEFFDNLKKVAEPDKPVPQDEPDKDQGDPADSLD